MIERQSDPNPFHPRDRNRLRRLIRRVMNYEFLRRVPLDYLLDDWPFILGLLTCLGLFAAWRFRPELLMFYPFTMSPLKAGVIAGACVVAGILYQEKDLRTKLFALLVPKDDRGSVYGRARLFAITYTAPFVIVSFLAALLFLPPVSDLTLRIKEAVLAAVAVVGVGVIAFELMRFLEHMYLYGAMPAALYGARPDEEKRVVHAWKYASPDNTDFRFLEAYARYRAAKYALPLFLLWLLFALLFPASGLRLESFVGVLALSLFIKRQFLLSYFRRQRRTIPRILWDNRWTPLLAPFHIFRKLRRQKTQEVEVAVPASAREAVTHIVHNTKEDIEAMRDIASHTRQVLRDHRMAEVAAVRAFKKRLEALRKDRR